MEQIDSLNKLLSSSSWYRAITLRERAALLSHSDTESLVNTITTDTKHAQRHLQKWRAQKPFKSDTLFLQRLALDQLNEKSFQHILVEDILSLQTQLDHSPDWLIRVHETYYQPNDHMVIDDITGLFDNTHQLSGLLTIAAPLLHQSRKRLQNEIQELTQDRKTLPFDPKTIYQILITPFTLLLLQIIQQTLILELNVARLQGNLDGNTPQERFASFVAQLQQPDITHKLLDEYPVLTRLMAQAIERWETVSLEFLHRLCTDWEHLCATFAIDPTCYLTELQMVGDLHHDGRVVSIATFDSGFRIVYKPRSLAIYQHMQDLVQWLNVQYATTYDHTLLEAHPPFRTCKIIERDTYGWMEYIDMQPCTTPEEIQRFYYRQGCYLALLYAIAATDIHYENIIAAGEYPVLIDLETLFEPQFGRNTTSEILSDQAVEQNMYNSVLRVGILPYLLWTNDEFVGLELSSLGGKQGQINPHRVLHWDLVGTDSVQAMYKNAEMPSAYNRPTLNGAEVRTLDYTDTIVQGFTDLYNLLVNQKAALLDEQGQLMAFAQDQIRVIVRPTLLYMILLQASYHPDVLRDALDRDRFFDKLWEDSEHNPHLLSVIATEHQSLWEGDVPMFVTLPSSLHLWGTDGVCIPNFFNKSGLTHVQQRIQQLGSDDLRRQQWYIRAAMTAQAYDGLPNTHKPLLHSSSHTIAYTDFVETASMLGKLLAELAWHRNDTASWVGIEEVRGQATRIRCLGPELYNGSAGIALFLAWLGHLTQEEHHTQLAQAVLTTMRQQLTHRQDTARLSIGGFGGMGGIIYTLMHLGILWKDSTLIHEATTLVTGLQPLIETDHTFDILEGSAGCLISLLRLHHCSKSPEALEMAIICGDRLVDNAQPMDVGLGWITHIPSSQPLLGLSHGASGIAWALLELATVTGISRFRDTAIAAIQYEDSLFSHTAKNWPDFRVITPDEDKNKTVEQYSTCFWCHGASGLGLARLHILKHHDTPQIRKDINVALQTTLNHGFGASHCLCHGDFGNLDLLLQARRILGDTHWYDQASHITSDILKQAQQHGWICGIPMGVETPGLMTGLAGIGYQLLRLAYPNLVPSILTLELPQPR